MLLNNQPSIDLFHLSEPKLTFGYGQKLGDPRDGLTLFGPFSRDKLMGQLNVGVIGPSIQREGLKKYLRSLHKPIFADKLDIARPYFPGLEAAFGVFINFENLKEIEVPITEINDSLKYSDAHQRIHNLCNLFSQKLIKYQKQEDMSVTIWFVAIPDDIYVYGRPKSRIPKSQLNVRSRLSRKEKQSTQIFIFDEMNQLREAYNFEANFHNQLKAMLLQDKIVTQIIRESTIGYRDLWEDENLITYQKRFDTAKAWNIATTLYYKAGGLPWKLGEVRNNVCYLGLVFKKLDDDSISRNACCAAQMFLDSGDGVVFRGHMGPWYNPESKEFHIQEADARDLLEQSLESFRDKSGDRSYPKEVFIHAKTYFDDNEWNGFLDASNGKCKIIGVRIRDNYTIKVYREFSYCVPRGTYLRISPTKAYLWTKGFIPRLQTQLGLETPNPVEVEITRGEAEIEMVCKDILALTKLNYNSCIFADGVPVTLKFADRIGEVLTAGKNVEPGVLPFKHYV